MSTKGSFLADRSDKAPQLQQSGKEQSGKSRIRLSIIANTAHDNQKDASAKDKGKEAAGDDTKLSNEEKFKQFEGDGVVFKAKLIGSELVMEPRGDKMCQNSIQRLKAIIKGQKVHKKRIVMKISYGGVKVFDEKTNELLYEHEVPQISFISSDDTDTRTFGYVCDVPNKAHQFVCFKTSGPAIQVMSVISSLFEAVLDKKKKEEDKSQEQVSATNNNNNNSTSNNANNNIFDDDNIDHNLSQLIIEDKLSDPPKTNPELLFTSNQQPPATTVITSEAQTKKASITSLTPPFGLIDAGDSGIVDTNSTGAISSIFSVPTATGTPEAAPQSQSNALSSTLRLNRPNQDRLQQLHNQHLQQQQQRLHRLSTQRQQQEQQLFSASIDRPDLLPLDSSSPVVKASAQPATNPPFSSPNLNRLAGSQNRSLIYNHSSVSLNDAALSTGRSSLMSPTSSEGGHNASTDKYAVFNDIDNLPSIFESTSSLGSKTNLTNVGQAPSSAPTGNFIMPMGASASSMTPSAVFGGLGSGTGQASVLSKSPMQTGGSAWDSSPSDKQAANAFFASSMTSFPNNNGLSPSSGTAQFTFGAAPDHSQQQQGFNRPAPTPSMMVPIQQSAPSTGGMVFGSAPMNAHQASAHARFSSSTAGLHQRLGSSAASIQSIGSASALSRQTNPFDDDFFS